MALAATTVPCTAAPLSIAGWPWTSIVSATLPEKLCPPWLPLELKGWDKRMLITLPAAMTNGGGGAACACAGALSVEPPVPVDASFDPGAPGFVFGVALANGTGLALALFAPLEFGLPAPGLLQPAKNNKASSTTKEHELARFTQPPMFLGYRLRAF
jgi:hypothetical protein